MKMNDGIMGGNLHYFKVVNGIELAVDQPWSFSCSPSILNVSSKNYTMNEEMPRLGVNHLHQQIIAPNAQITVTDEETGEETEMVRTFSKLVKIQLRLFAENNIKQLLRLASHCTVIIKSLLMNAKSKAEMKRLRPKFPML